jgi:hypothetical protein
LETCTSAAAEFGKAGDIERSYEYYKITHDMLFGIKYETAIGYLPTAHLKAVLPWYMHNTTTLIYHCMSTAQQLKMHPMVNMWWIARAKATYNVLHPPGAVETFLLNRRRKPAK